jgi:putative protease
MRFFHQKPVELLAPAGTFAIFERIVNANCDAVYFGGKRFNMRLHRKDYNFTNEELGEAVRIARSKNKKAYITVNNMYTQEELAELAEYLGYLAEIGPDAILIQDLGVITLLRRLGLSLPLHASVMMNVHNLASIQRLYELGIRRVVLSRELPLSYIRELSSQTAMEFEYFVHGDMCVSHGGQCLYSGILFGQSSNQGRCLKPCRWNFQIECGGVLHPVEFPLAVKDMCLYGHIPELIHNNVHAFKIEGRMRDPDYLLGLVNAYGDAIDRYIADPLGFDPLEGFGYLFENRKRDLSTAYAFGKPGLGNINRRMEGTGAFYSTGKPFSAAVEEPELDPGTIRAIREFLALYEKGNTRKPELACKVQTLSQARYCISRGVDHVYLSGEVFRPEKPFSAEAIRELCAGRGKSQIYLCQSRMMFDLDMEEYQAALGKPGERADLAGILASSLGGGGLELSCFGDYALNIQNSAAWEFYQARGFLGFAVSPEIRLPDLVKLLEAAGEWAELIVFGSPTVMYLEHDLFANTRGEAETLYLLDEKSFRHPVYRDWRGRNHILLGKDIFCLPFLGELYGAGLCRFRLEASHLDQPAFEEAVDYHIRALADPGKALELAEHYKPPRAGFTPGALGFLSPAHQ